MVQYVSENYATQSRPQLLLQRVRFQVQEVFSWLGARAGQKGHAANTWTRQLHWLDAQKHHV